MLKKLLFMALLAMASNQAFAETLAVVNRPATLGIAESAAQKNQYLYRAQLINSRLVMYFHLYTTEEGDHASLRNLFALENELTDTIGFLTGQVLDNGDAIKERFEKLTQKLEQNLALFKRTGTVPLQDIDDMLAHASVLNSLLGSAIQTSATSSDINSDDILGLALDLQQLATFYVERFTNAYGLSYQENSQSIEQRSKIIDAKLDQLVHASHNHKSKRQLQLLEQLATIEQQWSMIEPSFQNVKKQFIPFLVSRYSKSIADTLELIAHELEIPEQLNKFSKAN